MIYKFLLYENNFITYRIFYFFSYDSMKFREKRK